MRVLLFLLFCLLTISKASWSSPVSGGWVLTEDITVPMPAGWYPKVRSSYNFNTYWLSFLNPNTIFTNGQANAPSESFTQFSSNRDKADGPKTSDKVIYSIGGYSYSQGGYSWSMFDNVENAKVFAQAIVQWKQKYNMKRSHFYFCCHRKTIRPLDHHYHGRSRLSAICNSPCYSIGKFKRIIKFSFRKRGCFQCNVLFSRSKPKFDILGPK